MPAQQQLTFMVATDQVDSESRVEEIWLALLGLKPDSTSYHENFFLVGGDSLILAQILLRLQTRFSIELNLMELYQVLTISKMAAYCLKKQKAGLSLLFEEGDVIDTSENDSYPASAAQCGLWFVEQLQIENISLYNTGLEVEITGKLNTDYLVEAYRQCICKHPVLMATFAMNSTNKKLVLKPNKKNIITLTVIDSSIDDVVDVGKSLVQQQLDLSSGPMIYGVLHKLTKSHHVLQIYIHHIVTDGWSGKILLEGIFKGYKALVDKIVTKPALVKDYYQEYCLWQQEFLGSDACSRQICYWQRQLQNVSNAVPLFGHDSYAECQTQQLHRTAKCRLLIEKRLLTSLSEYCAQHSLSRFTLCFTAFALVFSESSGNRDFCFASPVANRKYQRWEQTVGYFVNLVVLRNTIQPNLSVLEYLSRQQTTVLDALENQDLPFQHMISSLGLAGTDNPLFDVLFSFHKNNMALPELDGLTISHQEISKPYQHYKLHIKIVEENDCLDCALEYASDYFSQEQMEITLIKFEKVVQEIIRKPLLLLSDIFHHLEESC